uniref:Putative secreted protein n=1 Tax=Ixodes ricinus TaxID=34613 RepID=A0A6B0V4Y7_IXORI
MSFLRASKCMARKSSPTTLPAVVASLSLTGYVAACSESCSTRTRTTSASPASRAANQEGRSFLFFFLFSLSCFLSSSIRYAIRTWLSNCDGMVQRICRYQTSILVRVVVARATWRFSSVALRLLGEKRLGASTMATLCSDIRFRGASSATSARKCTSANRVSRFGSGRTRTSRLSALSCSSRVGTRPTCTKASAYLLVSSGSGKWRRICLRRPATSCTPYRSRTDARSSGLLL